MPEWLAQIAALSCLLAAGGILLALCVIDLRVRLLPNVLVFPFALLGIIFHTVSDWVYLIPADLLMGAVFGAGILYGIRFIANKLYQTDTLGLGDVKLMGAAGLWLGPDGVLFALIAGAVCGLLHGLAMAFYQRCKTGGKINLGRLEVPAGPGFAVGIVLAGLYAYAIG